MVFSIRQGDPLAMLLYIIYVEPLLNALERNLVGLQFPKEILEAYCDDINVMTSELDDFQRMSDTVSTFEKFSGAILSRNFKCKAMGLGKWSSKHDWPLPWLQNVDSVKIVA